MDFKTMSETIKPGTMCYLATSENGVPDIRGWQLQFIENGKIYFCTSNQKNVYKQLEKNPACSVICTQGGQTFRITGNVVFASKEETQKTHECINDDVKQIYPTADSNGFCAFYIEHGTVKHATGFAPFETFEF